MSKTDPLADKKVLLTTSHTDVGSGGSMQMFILAKGLCHAGAKVDILFKQSKPGKTPRLEIFDGLDVRIGFFRPGRWYSPFQLSILRRRLKREKYDIVHTHKGGDLSLILFASRGIKIPVLVNTRGVNFPLGLNRFKYNFKKLDRVIVVSAESKTAMANCGVNPEKIEVIYGGVDVERFFPVGDGKKIRVEFSIPLHAPVFSVIANLVKQKGHEDYLNAAAILEKTHPGCFHIFTGSGDKTRLFDKGVELGISKQIIFAGFRKDIPDIFAASYASVFPGFAGEGVSGVLRESLACQRPVITTDVGGNKEIIVDKKYGLVVPKRSPEMLAAAMAELLDNESLAKSMAKKGRVFILKNHSAQARNSRVFDLYLQIAGSKGYNW